MVKVKVGGKTITHKNVHKHINWRHVVYILIVIANIVAVSWIIYTIQTRQFGPFGSTHIHADFKVYVNGIESIDFVEEKYQEQDQLIHVENGRGNIIHMHATGVYLGYFFNSMGIEFTGQCLKLDTGEEYCNSGDKILKMYVNGERNFLFDRYVFKDLDRILITYGNDTPEQIAAQMATITNESCIESKKPCT